MPRFLAAIVGISLIYAQPLNAQLRSSQFEHLSLDEGLPSANVFAILQDHLGFLWLGTGSGLVRYDGYTMDVFLPDRNDPHSIGGRIIQALHEDEDGDLWISTADRGLSRFHRASERFTRYAYDAGRMNQLTMDGVRSITEDRKGNLWTGNGRAGVTRIEVATGNITSFRHDPDSPASLSSDDVHALFVSRAGDVWVGTAEGLNRFDEASGTFVRYWRDSAAPAGLGTALVRSLAEDQEGLLWIGTERGLVRFDASTGHLTHFRNDLDDPSSLASDSVYVLHVDSEGDLWAGTGRGLDRFDAATGEFIHHLPASHAPPQTGHNAVLLLYEDDGGLFWLATPTAIVQQGRIIQVPTNPTKLYSFDPRTATFVAHSPDRASPSTFDPGAGIRSIYQDRTGTLWIGTLMGGLNKLNPSASAFEIHRFTPRSDDRPESGAVRSVWEDRAGHVWVGTGSSRPVPGEGALYRLDLPEGIMHSYVHEVDDPRSLSWDYVGRIYEDRGGRLWIAGAEGLEVVDPETGTFKKYVPYPGRSNPLTNAVIDIDEDRNGKLWLATMAGGLLRFDPLSGTFEPFSPTPVDRSSTESVRLFCLRFDRSGTLWVGSSGQGLLRFDENTESFTSFYDASEGLVDVIGIHDDGKGRFWLATTGDGLIRFDRTTGEIDRFTTRDGLAHNSVQAILEDDMGHLWVSTRAGLTRFDPDSTTFRNFDARDGLGGGHFIARSAFRGKDGRLYFGGSHGLSIVYPDQVRDNAYPPPVVITGLRAFGRLLVPDEAGPLRRHMSVADEVRLSHRMRDLTFEFAAIHFTRPEKNRYAYKLEGFDDEWRNVGAQRTATYTNLSSGTYTFRVKAANLDGVWNETGASVQLIVVPPWWRSAWFYALGLIALVALAYAAYAARVHQLQTRARVLREEVIARTRELVAEKQTTEAQARRLAELDQTKSRFFANISHEFRTPLTLILGPLQDALERDGESTSLSHTQLRFMHGSARRLLRLVNQLLDLSKLEAGKMRLDPQSGDFEQFLSGLVRQFVPLAERRRITLDFRWNGEIEVFGFDPEALEKVFSNLLSNALKFTPAGGKVWMTAQSRNAMEGTFVEVVVKDTGRGIPASAAERIFDPFEQVGKGGTRSHEGTGLGLALARELVELHGGTIRMESELGFGTVFIVRIPMTTGYAHDSESARGAPELVSAHNGTDGPGLEPSETAGDGIVVTDTRLSSSKLALDPADEDAGTRVDPDMEDEALVGIAALEISTLADVVDREFENLESTGSALDDEGNARRACVLIVEDNPDVRRLLRDELVGDYRLIEAEDGEEGLDAARRHRPDLILTDVMMPRMDGYALCRAVKADPSLQAIPVILLTARASEESRIYGIEGGADDYLVKPFSRRELQVRVANLILSRKKLRQKFSRELLVKPGDVIIQHEDEAFVERVLQVIETHLGDAAFTTDVLADALDLGRRQAERRVKELTGETPSELLRRLRLERAVQLLRVRPGSISEVAYTVGFKSPSHFASLFRKVYGVSPSEHIENAS